MGSLPKHYAQIRVGTMRFFTVGFFWALKKKKQKPQSSKVQQDYLVLFGFLALKQKIQCISWKSWGFPTLDDICRLEYTWQQLE